MLKSLEAKILPKMKYFGPMNIYTYIHRNTLGMLYVWLRVVIEEQEQSQHMQIIT